tara:strand:- start:124 stop:1245 length:1122 start_codon:yes stop_codon:yes gene_type:complete
MKDLKSLRLKDREAKHLGLPVKSRNDKGYPKYKLSDEQVLDIKAFRNGGILEIADKLEVDPSTVKHLWKKTKEESVFIKNPLFVTAEEKTYFDLRDVIIEDLKKFSPKFTKIKRTGENDEGHLLVVDPADIHIGKLATAFETNDPYNSQIAVKRVIEGVQGLINKSRGFNIDKVLFIGGNDILHIDTPDRRTTSGTPQDTDGMWYENFLIAKQLYIDVLQMLLPIADVHFCFNPSNHDYTNGFFLADVIQTYFKDCKNMTFDCSIAHRKYYAYGKNLIMTTHGDGAKQQDLGSLMSVEAKDLWAYAEHRYAYTHHIHHKTAKDFINITVESLRSPSGADSWHHRKGYTGAPKAVEGFIHHRDFGQVARLTHIF